MFISSCHFILLQFDNKESTLGVVQYSGAKAQEIVRLEDGSSARIALTIFKQYVELKSRKMIIDYCTAIPYSTLVSSGFIPFIQYETIVSLPFGLINYV